MDFSDDLPETVRVLGGEPGDGFALCHWMGQPTPDELDVQEIDGGATEAASSEEGAMAKYRELRRRCGSRGSTGGNEVPATSGSCGWRAAGGTGRTRAMAPVVWLSNV